MPGTDSRRDLGAAGDAAACAHLERNGDRILARNARADCVELNVVAEHGGVVVFVAVKTRRRAGRGGAAEPVDAHKPARIARGAAAWLQNAEDLAQASFALDSASSPSAAAGSASAASASAAVPAPSSPTSPERSRSFERRRAFLPRSSRRKYRRARRT
jgi:Holliday junction resolvase-like predicted endonuclease